MLHTELDCPTQLMQESFEKDLDELSWATFFREIANLPWLHDDPKPQPTPCFDSGFTSRLVSLDLDVLKFALRCR